MSTFSLPRRYAAVTGSLAFSAMIVRGLAYHSGVMSTLRLATLSLVVAALWGATVGWLAGKTMDDSIRSLFTSGPDQAEPVGRATGSETG